MRKFTHITSRIFALLLVIACLQVQGQGTFQPANVPYSGADLNAATNNALRNWEVQCGVAANYFGSINVNLTLPNDQLVLDHTNQVRAAINGRTVTLGGNTVTFACGPLTMSANLTNFGTQWKTPRRLLHYTNNCDNSVHLLDTTTVFSCSNTPRTPIAQWKKWGITNAAAAFAGESNGEFWLDPDDGAAYNFSESTLASLYGWWFLDGPGAPYYQNWGHLNHMRSTFSTKLGYTVFYLDPDEGKVSTYVWHSKVEVVLPIELISFSARNAGEANELNWETASEKDNDRFEIERSSDGRNFEKIGEEKGAGDSQQRLNYEFSDREPLDGTAYYRLRQVDYDGQFSFSPVRQVTRAKSLVLKASPNPTTDIVSFTGLPDSDDEDYTVIITDTSGRLVMTANNEMQVNLSALPNGLYFATVTTTTTLQTIRVSKN